MGLISRLLIFSIFFVAYLAFASPLFAQAGTDFAGLDEVNKVFENAVTWVAIIGGFLSFIALIYGGFKYILARGDPKAIAGAQGTITWAILGLAFIIIAWLILVFIEDFTGVSVTNFDFKSPFPD